MKRFGLLAITILSAVRLSSAAVACANETLADYIMLGSSGCTVAGNTFANFAVAAGSTGATVISPSAILLSPSGGPFDPSLKTSLSATASAGNILEAAFTFTISGNLYTSSSVALSNSSETGDGAVSGLQDFCAGTAFASDGSCPGTPGSLLTLDGVQNEDAATFSPVTLLDVTNDFTVDGGLAGTASAGDLTDRFTAAPEPATLLFTATGLALVFGFGLRRAAAQSVSR